MSEESAHFDLLRLFEEAGSMQDRGLARYRALHASPGVSVALVHWPGPDDDQNPHDQDEYYYVVSGSATIMTEAPTGAHRHQVGSGSLVYVPAGMPHRFEDIQNLRVLVVWAPPRPSDLALLEGVPA